MSLYETPIARKPRRHRIDKGLVLRFLCHANFTNVLQTSWRSLQALREVLKLCKQRWSGFYQVWTRGPSSVDVEESRKALEEGIKGEDFYYSVNAQMERIGHMLQRQLELKKPQRGQ
jgi:hypothetical protein